LLFLGRNNNKKKMGQLQKASHLSIWYYSKIKLFIPFEFPDDSSKEPLQKSDLKPNQRYNKVGMIHANLILNWSLN
jgi:Tfp pilus assembly protein PilP